MTVRREPSRAPQKTGPRGGAVTAGKPANKRVHELEVEAPPHGWLQDAKSVEALAARRVMIADIETVKARRELREAQAALEAAESALDAQIAYVADERKRLREERANEAGGAGALQRWRRDDERLIFSVDDFRGALQEAREALEQAENRLIAAIERQRQRRGRHEKFVALTEALTSL